MGLITPALLIAVGAKPAQAALYAPLLEQARQVPGDAFNTITSRSGIAMLVSQLAHESGYFSTLSESLNYSVEALRTGNRAKYFSPGKAQEYGYVRGSNGAYLQRANQRMIANFYYGGRLGNLGTHTDDGWDCRGGGLIQYTGRYNYTRLAASLNMNTEEAIAYCRTPEGAVTSALVYWRTHGLLIPASHGDVTRCTEIIQGADGGLQSRIALYKAALAALV
jgi:putative chitinase